MLSSPVRLGPFVRDIVPMFVTSWAFWALDHSIRSLSGRPAPILENPSGSLCPLLLL